MTLGKLSKQLGLLSEYNDVNLTGMLDGLSEINVISLKMNIVEGLYERELLT